MSLDGDFFCHGADPGCDAFAGVFEGCFEKYASLAVVFDGENVVICMVNVVKKTCDFRSKKIRHEFQFYFWSDQHSRTETNELVA